MRPVLNLALKDLKVLWRDKMATFFILGFPILMGLFFGYVFGGNSNGGSAKSKITLLVIDEDQSEESKKLLQLLGKSDNLKLEETDRVTAENSVRKGERVAYLAIPEGYGETAGVMWQEQTPLDLAVDPSRSAEGAMIEGFIMQAAGEMMMTSFTDFDRTRTMIKESLEETETADDLSDTQRSQLTDMFGSMEVFIDSLDVVQNSSTDGTGDQGNARAMNLVEINRVPVTKQKENSAGPTSGYEVSFPQGMIWGVLACCAGFAISIARERSQGTLLRLQASPLTVTKMLLGKGVACFIAVCFVVVLMTVIGAFLGLRPKSFPLLAISGMATAICFVGIMMTMSVLGRTEEAVGGSGWAVNTVMAMLGGGMIPLMFMPEFLKALSLISPVRWAIYSLEGAIWRELTVEEMMVPWLVLLSIGAAGFIGGAFIFQRSVRTS